MSGNISGPPNTASPHRRIEDGERKGFCHAICPGLPADLDRLLESPATYREFFENAPCLNANRRLIRGSVCGVRVESIDDPLMQEIRYLDKLVDELAKGKPMKKILRQ